jgi:hypothetical protein
MPVLLADEEELGEGEGEEVPLPDMGRVGSMTRRGGVSLEAGFCPKFYALFYIISCVVSIWHFCDEIVVVMKSWLLCDEIVVVM